jgi:hypothetical protein
MRVQPHGVVAVLPVLRNTDQPMSAVVAIFKKSPKSRYVWLVVECTEGRGVIGYPGRWYWTQADAKLACKMERHEDDFYVQRARIAPVTRKSTK